MRRSLVDVFAYEPEAAASLYQAPGARSDSNAFIVGCSALGGSGAAPPGAGSGAVGSVATTSRDSLPARIRRLTNAEYDASVQVMLGTVISPSEDFSFPPDATQGPTNSPAGAAFTVNDARVDQVLAEKLDAAAQAVPAGFIAPQLHTSVALSAGSSCPRDCAEAAAPPALEAKCQCAKQ